MLPELNTTSLGSIREDGSKLILHPADVSGRYTTWRRRVAAVLLIIYVALPWIPVNGFPAVFLDVQERRFHFFGLTLAAQDLWVFFFLISGLGFSLFFVTSLLGRIWCGWTCPYTVFLDHLFRRVERLIDGDAPARRQLDAAPWDHAEDRQTRGEAHDLHHDGGGDCACLFVLLYLHQGAVRDHAPLAPGSCHGFGVVAFLTVALYFCFSWFREQFCVIMCPYGRMQSALVDDNSIHHRLRQEARGAARQGQGCQRRRLHRLATAACRCAPRASTSATDCSWSASPARPAWTPATTS